MKLDLYVITDSRLAGARGNLATIEDAIAGGATVVQLREKDMSTRQMVELGRALRALTKEAGVTFIVNDRIDVALAVDADGVHVGQDDMPADLARRLIGPSKLLGVSAANVAEAMIGKRGGADYLGVGPIYPTGTKADAGAATGTRVVAEIRRATGLPVVGIGGIDAGNAASIIAAGGDGVAVISAIVGKPDPRQAAEEILNVVTRARRPR